MSTEWQVFLNGIEKRLEELRIVLQSRDNPPSTAKQNFLKGQIASFEEVRKYILAEME